jgi:DNA helicase-2/ATP-dependent DNA helicase PcrA
VAYVPGKAGSSLGAFVRLIEQMRAETSRMTLPETVEYVTNTSGLMTHYQTEKEGQDRIENLQELVTAAQAFVVEEGYGLDALARMLPATAMRCRRWRRATRTSRCWTPSSCRW